MNTLLQTIILSCTQGLTEFLPISSTAHIILIPKLFGWVDQGLVFDVSVHIGTLISVIIYFRYELYCMIRDSFFGIVNKNHTSSSKLLWLLMVSSVPVGFVGFFFKNICESYLRAEVIISFSTMIFAIILGVSICYSNLNRSEYTLNLFDAFFIGFAQILALIPGVSRSGITITAGLMIGLNYKSAINYSFLLSIPVILFAGLLEFINMNLVFEFKLTIFAILCSSVVSYFTMHFFINLVDKFGLWPFVIYRLFIGILLLY